MKRTRLTRKAPLVGSTPLQRATRLTRTAAARKRPERTREEVEARRLVAQRSGGVCEVCGNATATNFHHRKGKGQGGAWAPSNGLHLCGSGSTGCHGHVTTHPQVSREQGWSVPSYLDPLRTPVWLARHGWAFLDDHGTFENEEAA